VVAVILSLPYLICGAGDAATAGSAEQYASKPYAGHAHHSGNKPVLRSRKYFFRLWLHGAANPNFGSGSRSSYIRYLENYLL
jgi:hypothetical protein